MSIKFSPQVASPMGAPIVTDENLDNELRDYISVLAEQNPFSISLDIDAGFVIPRLAERWPDDPVWPIQANTLWDMIDKVVHSIPLVNTHGILLRVSASAEPFVPDFVPEPHVPTALATFDGVSGVMHRCILPPLEKLPKIKEMSVPLGLIVICQPVPILASELKEKRGLAVNAENEIVEANIEPSLPENNLG